MKQSDRKYWNRHRKSKGNRLLAVVLCISLTLSSFAGISFVQPKKAEAEAQGNTLSNPRIVADNSMQAKQKVTWDCIWFGSYPQAEVVPASREYTALDKKLLQDGDLIKDDALYQTLQAATGWDGQGDIVISGDKYCRIKKEDATYTSTASNYYQWKNGTEYHYFKYQPIKWRVLSVNGSEAFLLADKALDDKQYHTVSENVTWEGSTVRSWLNGYGASANLQKKDYSSSNFINTAFSSSARAAIKDTRVENKDNLSYGTEGGEDTVDKVFLLSESEVYTDAAKGYGFVSAYSVYDEARRAKSSVYAKALGTWSNDLADYVGNCDWWLRSPGDYSDYATNVYSDGWVYWYNNDVGNLGYGVRPALNLNLAASPDAGSPNLWSYAGTVCSDGTVQDAITEYDFISQHVDFAEKNNTYHNLLKHCDLSNAVLRDYGELKDTYDVWRAVRKKLFDNPYEIVLADMIINENMANNQIKNFNMNLYSTQRSIINNIMKLIDGKVSLKPDEKNKIQKLFTTRDFSDSATYQLCQEILGGKISDSELQTVFQVYDTSNKFMSLLGDGKKIVDSVIDVINYSSILHAYYATSDEFQTVLMQVDFYCQNENTALDYAIAQYLSVESQHDIRNDIIKKAVGNTIEVGMDLFQDAFTKKVSNFLLENMDLSEVESAAASNILSFIEGMKIGYHIGVTIDNILFNTDKVSDSYVAAYASAKVASYLKMVLQDNSKSLIQNHSLKNAELFCETFNMYKWIQEDVANKMIQYFASNQQSFLEKIFKSGEYETALCQWQVMKLSWSNINCHEGILSSSKMKCITIACPVNIRITDTNGRPVLEVEDDKVGYSAADVEFCVRNGIKYITLPDADYNVGITATGEGAMSYSIASYDNFVDLVKTVHYEGIKLIEGTDYKGKIVQGDLFTESDCALIANGETVDSSSTLFTENEKVNIDSITLLQEGLSMEVGDIYKMQANVLPQDASIKTLTWYSEDPDIASVNEYGVITAKSIGETGIVCMDLDGVHMKKCNLLVKEKTAEPSESMSPIPGASSTPEPMPPTPDISSAPELSSPTPNTSLSPEPTRVPDNPYIPYKPVLIPTSVPAVTTVPSVSPSALPTAIPSKTPEVVPSGKPIVTPAPSITPEPSAEPSSTPKADNKKKPAKSLKKGAMVSDSKTKAVYNVTGAGKNKTVEYVRSTKKNASKITVPAKVKLRGQNYKVTSIAKNALKNSKKLSYVIIGKNVKKIGKKAFYGCKKLRYIYVKSKKLVAKDIGKQAFGNGYQSPRVKSAKSVWRRYARILPAKGLSKRAVYIINPVKLVL